jgi:hypothetical protein
MRPFLIVLGPLLLSACGATDPQATVDLLHQRLHARMAADERSGSATIQDLPFGAVVTIADPATATGPAPATVEARTDMVEALLDPALLRIGVVPPGNLPSYEADMRAQAWQTAFSREQIGQSLQRPYYMPPPEPDLTVISIQVVCPRDAHRHWIDVDGRRRPAC